MYLPLKYRYEPSKKTLVYTLLMKYILLEEIFTSASILQQKCEIYHRYVTDLIPIPTYKSVLRIHNSWVARSPINQLTERTRDAVSESQLFQITITTAHVRIRTVAANYLALARAYIIAGTPLQPIL